MNPPAPRQLIGRLLRWRAGRRRARGRYDRKTLRLYQRAAHLAGPGALVDYLHFRRDLGYPLHPRFIEPLCRDWGQLPKARRWLAAALLLEAKAAPLRVRNAIEPGPGIVTASANQENWREGFALAAQVAAAERGICLVGNAASLKGSGLGERIDAAGFVIRFNDFRGGRRDRSDTGRRTSAWVTNASYDGPRFDQADWVVISGPDMCFRLRDWTDFTSRLRLARPVLTVPLPVWRDLVRVLHAPPSAGLLMLAWLHDLLGSWHNVTAAGIGTGAVGPYHLHGKSRGSVRHDWAAEAALVATWARQGLAILPSTAEAPIIVPELAESLP